VKKPSPDDRAVRLRIRVSDPVPGCTYGLQLRGGSVEQAQVGAAADLVFTTDITLTTKPATDFRGVHVQGPKGGRFLYINSGTLAGQSDSCWTRRAKVPLNGLEQALPSAPGTAPLEIETRIAGRARDGGPACASVPLLQPWKRVAGE
jgi:hypothetical protein